MTKKNIRVNYLIYTIIRKKKKREVFNCYIYLVQCYCPLKMTNVIDLNILGQRKKIDLSFFRTCLKLLFFRETI